MIGLAGKTQEKVGRAVLEMLMALAVGAAAGYRNIFRDASRLVAGPLSTLGVVLLLFFMGLKIGADETIMGNLAIMGLEAFVYAVAAIAGSVIVVWAWQRLTAKDRASGSKGGAVP